MTEAEAEVVPPEQEQEVAAEGEGEGEGEVQPLIEDGAELADEEAEQDEGEEGEAEEVAEVAPVAEPEPVREPEPFVPGPLVISEAHENFTLDKKMEDDPSMGLPNPRHIICQFCEVILIPDGNAIKCTKELNLIQNTQREYDLCSTYWHVDSLIKF